MQSQSAVKEIFDHYGGIMRTKQLLAEKLYYKDIHSLIDAGAVEKIRTGYYAWIDPERCCEAATVRRLFPDGVLCMDTALYHYGYTDQAPTQWHLAVNKYANRSRFRLRGPSVKPYYVEPILLSLGVCEQMLGGIPVRMYDKERLICDCLRYRNKIDRTLFRKAMQAYIVDSEKNIPRLMAYAKPLRIAKLAQNMVEVWL